jgi:NhaC family Na+:H+ antiporter
MSEEQASTAEENQASIGDALVPLVLLVGGLFLSVRLYGEDSSYGPNQIVLLLAGCVSLLMGLKNGFAWSDLEKNVFRSMTLVFVPSFILLAVGIMIATWIAGGVVPTMIYYGLTLMHPGIFYAAACLVCAIVALSIGSSWTTAASVGVAMIGTATGLGLSPAICAGAIISGAYFGDKMSPLSDTTNLAPAVAGVELFSHIRHMTWTTFPSLVIALVLFTAIGLAAEPSADTNDLEATLALLESNYTIGWYLLLPLVALFYLAWKKMPAFPAILIAAFLGLLCAWWFQSTLSGGEEGTASKFETAWTIMFAGYSAQTGDAILDDLLSGGGAASMLNTIWLILCALFFGGTMEQTGMLKTLVAAIMRRAKTTASIISSTILTCISANIIAADQYMAIVVPGRMYKVAFRHHNLAPVNLSRAIEDAGTVTSPLVPWNTCGAFMAVSLGVPTFVYLPFCFFNLLMPVISMLYGIINFKILPLEDVEAESTLPDAT